MYIVSADQYRMTVSRAQLSTHRSYVFFEVYRWQVSSFQLIAGSNVIGLFVDKEMFFVINGSFTFSCA